MRPDTVGMSRRAGRDETSVNAAVGKTWHLYPFYQQHVVENRGIEGTEHNKNCPTQNEHEHVWTQAMLVFPHWWFYQALISNIRVEEKFLSLDPITSATVRRVIYYLSSRNLKGRRKCWKLRMKKRRKMKLMKRSRKSERTLNSCMRHGDDHGMD